MAFSQSGQALWNLVQRYNLRNCRTDLGPFHERNHFRSHFGQILLLAPELPRNEHTSQTNIVDRDRVRYFINSRQIRQTGDKGNSSLWRQQPWIIDTVPRAYGINDRIEKTRTSDLSSTLKYIFGPVIDHFIRTQVTHVIYIGGRTRCHYHRSQSLCQLDGKSADSAASAMNQNQISGLTMQPAIERIIGGESGTRNRSGINVSHWFRNFRNRMAGYRAQLSIGAVSSPGGETAHTVPRSPAGNVYANLFDNSRGIDSEHMRI